MLDQEYRKTQNQSEIGKRVNHVGWHTRAPCGPDNLGNPEKLSDCYSRAATIIRTRCPWTTFPSGLLTSEDSAKAMQITKLELFGAYKHEGSGSLKSKFLTESEGRKREIERSVLYSVHLAIWSKFDRQVDSIAH